MTLTVVNKNGQVYNQIIDAKTKLRKVHNLPHVYHIFIIFHVEQDILTARFTFFSQSLL